jgi:hypothetical protein
MGCKHDIADKDTAIADGLCPLCLEAEVDRLQKVLVTIVAIYEKPYPSHSPLTANGWKVYLAEQMRDVARKGLAQVR